MKTLIVYSSVTGNTEKVAKAIYEVFEEGTAALFPVEKAPSAESYDFVVAGFWVDKGTADQKAREYLQTIRGKDVALFATLGAYPDSEHGINSLKNAAAVMDGSNRLVGTFICQGKIDPRLIEQFKNMPGNHPHQVTPERLQRYEEAAKHPDAKDLQAAREAFAVIKETVSGKLAGEKGKGAAASCGEID